MAKPIHVTLVGSTHLLTPDNNCTPATMVQTSDEAAREEVEDEMSIDNPSREDDDESSSGDEISS